MKPDHKAVMAQVERICASKYFARSSSAGKLLKHVVGKKLDGDISQLKEANIGVDVMGKQAGYDTRVDASVRIAIMKTRKALKAYYESDGEKDTILIELEPGEYEPEIIVRREQMPLPLAQNNAPVSQADISSLADLARKKLANDDEPTEEEWGALASIAKPKKYVNLDADEQEAVFRFDIEGGALAWAMETTGKRMADPNNSLFAKTVELVSGVIVGPIAAWGESSYVRKRERERAKRRRARRNINP